MGLDIVERVTAYLSSGGLFNPELANHDAVRVLLMDARDKLAEQARRISELESNAECYEGMKEGTNLRIADLQAEIAQLKEDLEEANQIIKDG